MINDNELMGYLPSFLQTKPNYLRSFDAINNQFYCPLPTWCASGTGDGMCAPCYSPPS